LKSLFSILLAVLLLLPSFGSFFAYSSFKLNQDEIAKTICIQRKMVNNSCNGRCELQKSLKKYEDNEKKMQNNLDNKVDFVFIQNTVVANNFKLIEFRFSGKPNFFVLEKKAISVSLSSFRPPSYLI
jgi:plasmid maintenance system antidote protein VapI